MADKAPDNPSFPKEKDSSEAKRNENVDANKVDKKNIQEETVKPSYEQKQGPTEEGGKEGKGGEEQEQDEQQQQEEQQQEEQQQEEQQQEEQVQNFLPVKSSKIINKHGIVFLVVALGIILGLVLSYDYDRQGSGIRESSRMFHKSFARLEAAFPGQTSRFWRILRNRATAHLKNPNPKKPLVLMFTAGPSAHNVLECIARKLAKSLEPGDNGLGYIKSIDYQPYSSLDDAKKILDETLKQLLQKGRTVLVFNVDKLPVQSPLLFYEYCDNENAPYKQAAIIFTVRLPLEPDPSLEPFKAEGLVAKYLEETWGKQEYSRPDDIPPLVNRMTDTVVMVKEESDETMKKNCAT